MSFFDRFLSIFSLVFTASTSETNELSLDLMPDKAKSLAEIAVQTAEKMRGKHLDYSPESLKVIDQLVLGFREEGNTAEAMNRTLVVLGCYVGEVMVRSLGYKWDNPNKKEMSVGFSITGVRASNGSFSNPIGKVFKLMENGKEDSVAWFYKVASSERLR